MTPKNSWNIRLDQQQIKAAESILSQRYGGVIPHGARVGLVRELLARWIKENGEREVRTPAHLQEFIG